MDNKNYKIIIIVLLIIIFFLIHKNKQWEKEYKKCVLIHRNRENHIKNINKLI